MIWTVAALSVLPLAAAFAMREQDDPPSHGARYRPSLRAFWRGRRRVRPSSSR